MKKKIIIPTVVVGGLAATGIAWAALTGTVALPQASQGTATPGAPAGCQTSSLAFTVPDPVWNNATGAYEIATIDYAGIDSACQNSGADLELHLVNNGATLADASELNLTTAGGTLTLSAPVDFAEISVADFVYLVKG
jgi:hypothetical protein